MSYVNGICQGGGFDRYNQGDTNLYYRPEKNGLRILVEGDWGGDWEFDKVVVWEDVETHELIAAQDSGCSCPDPFAELTREGAARITSPADLDPLFAEVSPEVKADDPRRADIVAKVHRHLAP